MTQSLPRVFLHLGLGLALGAGCDRPPARESSSPVPQAAAPDPRIPGRLAGLIRDSPTITAALLGRQEFDETPTHPAIRLAPGIWHPIRSPFLELTSAQVSRLRGLLLPIRRSAFVTDCTFMPDVVYRFASPVDSIRVIVCHTCGEVWLLSSGKEWGAVIEGKPQPFVEFAHELFPDDAHIEKIRTEWLPK